MALQTDGVWKGGVWAAGVWADCVWAEPILCGAPAPAPASTGRGSSGRSYTWSPEPEYKKDKVLKYKKSLADLELEKLLKAAIKRDDLAASAKKIADKLNKDVSAVSHIRDAARVVSDELNQLMVTQGLSQKVAQKRLDALREEEDLILSLILMEM